MRTKKKLFAAALAICLLSTVSFSTLAWFNASESVTNRFMIASSGSGTGTGSGSTAEKIFSVDLWEYIGDKGNLAHEDKDPTSGNPIVDSTEKDHDGIEFKDILPGVVYHKEPVVENTGSYDQYIRVVITVTKATAWKQILNTYGITDLDAIFLEHDDTAWTRDTSIKLANGSSVEAIVDNNNDTISYVYYLNEKLEPGQMVAFFTGVKLPEQLTQADMAKLLDTTSNEVEFNIDVRADAIQTEGIGNTVTNAETAFEFLNWTLDKKEL